MDVSQSKVKEVLKKLLKYLVEGFVVSFVAFWVPKRRMRMEDILALAVTAATTFAVLDTFAPSIVSKSARFGTGFGIGASLGAGMGGPIFPAENFINSAPYGEETSNEVNNNSELLGDNTQPMSDDNVAKAGDLLSQVDELERRGEITKEERDSLVDEISSAADAELKKQADLSDYPIPLEFKSQVGDYFCKWKPTTDAMIDGVPQGFEGKCFTADGLISLTPQ